MVLNLHVNSAALFRLAALWGGVGCAPKMAKSRRQEKQAPREREIKRRDTKRDAKR